MLIERTHLLQWLDRQSRLSPVLLVEGLRGSGKTKLLESWLKKSPSSFQWYSIGRFTYLTSLLNLGSSQVLSVDESFEVVSRQWGDLGKTIVVWDDIHLLSSSVLTTLLNFIRYSPQQPLHVFLSDETLTEMNSADLEIASLKMPPLSLAEIRPYVESVMNRATSEAELNRLLEETGGLPLLINLWLSNPETSASSQKRIFGKLSSQEILLLDFAAGVSRAFDPETVENVNPLLKGQSKAVALQLRKRFLLDSLPHAPQLFKVPAYIQALWLKEKTNKERRNIAAQVLEILTAGDSQDSLEKLLHALRAHSRELILEQADQVPLERLETLSKEDLSELLTLLSDARPFPETATRLQRLFLRALFFSGKRKESIEFLDSLSITKTISSGTELASKERQQFLLEIIQAFNRAGDTKKARQISEMVIAQTEEPVQTQIGIEIGVASIYESPHEAAALLKMRLQSVEKNETLPERDSILASAAFQYARCLNVLKDLALADRYYQMASEKFLKIHRPYFSAVSLLNRAWMAFNAGDWRKQEKIHCEMAPLLDRYAYAYVRAGVSVIEAARARMEFEVSKAISRIEAAQSTLGSAAPLAAKFDVLGEKVLILSLAGFRSKAIESFRLIEGGIQEAPTFRSRFQMLHLLLQASILSSEELLERWEKCRDQLDQEDREPLLVILLQRGLIPASDSQIVTWRSAIGHRAALLERELTDSIKEDRRADAWRLISKLERLLLPVTDALPERVALLLLQSMLIDAGQVTEKEKMLSRAEMELLRLSGDVEAKAPFEAWLSCLKDSSSKQSVSTHPAWQKALLGDRERWQRWWGPLFRETKRPYIVLTEKGCVDADTVPAATPNGLTIISHLADVSFRGKQLKTFVRRHALRKLLEVLVENSAGFADKATIASIVWGEVYSPRSHDSRIYTSIQRLRTMLGKQDTVQNWETGYRWNPKYPFCLVRLQMAGGALESRCQSMIVQALEQYSKTHPGQGMGRGQLVELTGDSEATVKRQLAKLLSDDRIVRKGSGRSVTYCSKKQ